MFLRQNATKKKVQFVRKKIQKIFIVNNNNRIIRAWYLQGNPGAAHISPEEEWNFSGKD